VTWGGKNRSIERSYRGSTCRQKEGTCRVGTGKLSEKGAAVKQQRMDESSTQRWPECLFERFPSLERTWHLSTGKESRGVTTAGSGSGASPAHDLTYVKKPWQQKGGRGYRSKEGFYREPDGEEKCLGVGEAGDSGNLRGEGGR